MMTHMHTGTAVAWDNKAKQRLWKSRFKVNKKYGRPLQSTGITASIHIYIPVDICSQLFTPVHTCSHLFAPLHTSLTIYALRAMAASRWIFPCESRYFWILRAIFLKLHIFVHLIESYPMVYGLSSCVEKKMLIPLVAHTTVTMYVRRTMSFFALLNVLVLKCYVVSCWNCTF